MKTGWSSFSTSLKVLFVLIALWTLGSLFAITTRLEMGIPLFGFWVSGILAGLTVLMLDIVGPITFLYTMWTKKSWGLIVAYSYMGLFLLNSVIAMVQYSDLIGLAPMMVPTLVTLGFLAVTYLNRAHFK